VSSQPQRSRLDRLVVSFALAALTVVAYEGVARCGFVDSTTTC
jgi:hypothetical protein